MEGPGEVIDGNFAALVNFEDFVGKITDLLQSIERAFEEDLLIFSTDLRHDYD